MIAFVQLQQWRHHPHATFILQFQSRLKFIEYFTFLFFSIFTFQFTSTSRSDFLQIQWHFLYVLLLHNSKGNVKCFFIWKLKERILQTLTWTVGHKESWKEFGEIKKGIFSFFNSNLNIRNTLCSYFHPDEVTRTFLFQAFF